MAGKFDVYKTGEHQLSDIEAVQSPVTPAHSGAAMSAFAGLLGEAGQGMQVYGRHQKAEAQAERKAQDMSFSNEYSNVIDTVSAGVDSGELSEVKARTLISKAKRDLISRGASADKLMATEAKSLKTLTGMVLTEETPEEAAEKARYKDFAGSRYWEYGATEEKQEENRRAYEAARVKNLGYDLEIEEANYQVQMAAGDKAKKERAEVKLLEAQKKKAQGVIKDLPSTFYNELQEAKKAVQPILETQGQAAAIAAYKAQVDRIRNSTLNNISNVAAQTTSGLPAQREIAMEMVNRLADTELKWTGSAAESEEAKANKELLLTKGEVAALEDIDVLSSTVIESLIPGSAILMQEELPSLIKSAKLNIQQAQERGDGGKIVDVDPSTVNGKSFLDLTNSMLSNVGKTHPNGDDKVDPIVVGKNVSALLAYIGDLGEQTDLKDLRKSISFLASPDFARFVREHPDTLGARDMANAQMALTAYQERVGQSTYNLLTQTISAEEKSKRLGKYAAAHAKVLRHEKPTEEGLDLKFINGQVVVIATEVGSRQLAKELTEKVNQPLTEAINASAALSTQSAESIFNEWLPTLWPSKYGETGQEQGSDQLDYSQYEGQEMVDEEGNVFIIRDGLPVKSGGGSDAAGG
jgi:hypothetical protein